MLRKSCVILFFILSLLPKVCSQIPGFTMERGVKKIEIPFERQNNFIVLKVLFQGFFPLTIMGTDMKTQIKAYIARKVQMDIPGLKLVKDILVLDEDYFKFDQFAGMDVQGILGAETFKGYVIKIDYYKQTLTIYDPSVFKPSE
jgi:hypothetical protein